MLGLCRLLLAVGVVLAHGKLLPEATSRSMVGGFFIVSGYLMMLTLSANYGRNILPFYWNRILRLYPLHIVMCVVIALAFHGFVARRFVEYNDAFGDVGPVMTVVMALLLLPRYAGFFNKPAWTLPFELVYYLMAPFLFRLGWQGRLAYLLAGVVGFAALHPIADLAQPFGLEWSASGSAAGFLASAVYFGLGALIFDLQRALRPGHAGRVALAVTAACLAAIVGLMAATSRFLPVEALELVLVANGTMVNAVTVLSVSALLFLWDGSETGWSKRAGDLCYPVYMIHFMFTDYLIDVPRFRTLLVRAAETAGWTDLEFVLRSAIALAGSLLLGSLWLIVEARTVRRLRRRPATAASGVAAAQPGAAGASAPSAAV